MKRKVYLTQEWLFREYVQNNRTTYEIALEINVTPPTVNYWLRKCGIARRAAWQRRDVYRGSKCHAFGKILSPKTRAKISKNHYNVSGKNNPMYGRSGPLAPAFGVVRDQDYRQKLSTAQKYRQRPQFYGSGNPFWKGGKTPLIVKLRRCSRGIDWRNEVFVRDNYACMDCGDNTGGNLNAHHIVSLAELVHTHDIKMLSEGYKIRDFWDIDNGITLCEKCHECRHRKYIEDKASIATVAD